MVSICSSNPPLESDNPKPQDIAEKSRSWKQCWAFLLKTDILRRSKMQRKNNGFLMLSHISVIFPRLIQISIYSSKRIHVLSLWTYAQPAGMFSLFSDSFSNPPLSASLCPFFFYFRAWHWPGSSLTCPVLTQPVSSIGTLPAKLAEQDCVESHAVWDLAALRGAPAVCCTAGGGLQGDDSVRGPQRHGGPRGPVWLQLPRGWRTAGLHSGGRTVYSPEKDQQWLVAGEKPVHLLFVLCLRNQRF